MNELDLSDLDKFVKDEESIDSSTIYEQSLKIIKEAMGDVRQEIIITLPDKSVHIVYVLKVDISAKGQVTVEFATPSEERKADLAEHVEKCVTMQLQEAFNEVQSKPKSFWKKKW